MKNHDLVMTNYLLDGSMPIELSQTLYVMKFKSNKLRQLAMLALSLWNTQMYCVPYKFSGFCPLFQKNALL